MRLTGKRIAIFLAEGVEDLEFYVSFMRLQEEGAEVLAAGLDLKPVREAAVGEYRVLDLGLSPVADYGALLRAAAPIQHIIANDFAPRQRRASHHDADMIQDKVLGPGHDFAGKILVLQPGNKFS